MSQLSFFKPDIETAVNVSKVPQRSPFRYPGGKTWFIPYLRLWLNSLPQRPALLVEPFAGGGIIGLTTAFERMADHVLLVELDEQVAAVWRTILGKHANWLSNRILDFEMNHESARRVIEERCRSERAKAFQTILKNRIYHGGILANGSGMMKNGENGKGLLSRWYPKTIARRISDISQIRDRITFEQSDGMECLKTFSQESNTALFVDPPYTAGGKRAGRRLYRYFELDHCLLFKRLSAASADFVLTYDDALEVRMLAESNNMDCRLVAMNNTHHANMKELLISHSFGWLD